MEHRINNLVALKFFYSNPGELTSIIQRSALDYKASPSVLMKCKYSIEMCKRQTGDFDGSMDDFEDGGVIEGIVIILRYMLYQNLTK